MAQHDYVIDNSTGANVRADINSVLQAIASNNSGSSAPSTTFAFQLFADTTNNVMKIRNAANNAYIELFQLDGTFTLEDGSASTPALAFRDDLNTGIFSSADNTFNIATNGVERMELGGTTIFNEDGADVDFRIEGDTEENLFFVDAGNNRIGIGISTPQTSLDIKDDEANIRLNSDANGLNQIQFGDANDSIRASIVYRNGTAGDALCFHGYNNTESMRIDSSGRLLIGKSATKGSTGEVVPTFCNEIASNNPNVFEIANNGTNAANSYSALVLSRSDSTSVNGHTAVDSGDQIGEVCFIGADGSDRFNTAAAIKAFANSDFTANNCPTNLTFHTNGGSASASERMRITDGGQVFMNCTNSSNTEVLQIRNTVGSRACMGLGTTATGFDTLTIFLGGCNADGSGGGVRGSISITATATGYNTSSDYRLKENVVPISDAITRLKTLKPSRFNFKIDKDTTVDGFLAHEVTAVPEAITGTKDEVVTQAMIDSGKYDESTLNDPIYQGIDQSKLVPLLVAAVQELIGKVEALEAA